MNPEHRSSPATLETPTLIRSAPWGRPEGSEVIPARRILPGQNARFLRRPKSADTASDALRRNCWLECCLFSPTKCANQKAFATQGFILLALSHPEGGSGIRHLIQLATLNC